MSRRVKRLLALGNKRTINAKTDSQWMEEAYKLQTKDGNFVDWRIVRFQAGKGGDGSGSVMPRFRSHFGPCDGGNGGSGGNIYLKVSSNVESLKNIQEEYLSQKGRHGSGNDKHGKKGKDIVIDVPVGTVIKDVTEEQFNPETDEMDDDYASDTLEQYFDLLNEGEKLLICRGGKGGRGNQFTEEKNRDRDYGSLGEIRYLSMELKTIADVGLVGLPNAGKSSFLRAVSHALPKVAPYPFTTLNPYLGVIDCADFTRFTIADIPGIIMGAHLNHGLGFSFLRHIERTKALVFVIDLSKPNPTEDFMTLRNELSFYDKKLLERPLLIVGNKMDRIPDGNVDKIVDQVQNECELPVIPTSAKYLKNVSLVTERLRRILEDLKKKEIKIDKSLFPNFNEKFFCFMILQFLL